MATHHEVGDEFILEFKASVIATDMNAHGQLKHGEVGQRKTRHAFT
jgi:hypothetical protein